jgi:uncharacterized protein with beta-barrel porin domain
MKTYFKLGEKLKKILNYLSIFTIVFGSIFGTLNSAYAADGDTGGTEVADGDTIIATDATGLKESNASAAVGISIVSGDAAISLGANGDADAITIDSADDEVVTISTSTTGSGTITFAGDIDLDGADDDLTVKVTNAEVIVGNNVKEDDASSTIFQLGTAGGANSSAKLVLDNQSDQAQDLSPIDSIVALDSDDTTNLTFRSSGTDTSDNVTTLGGVVGGAGNAAIDTITVGDTDGQSVLVEFTGTAITVGATTLGNGGSTADTITLTVDIGSNADITVAGTIDGSATDTTTLEIDGDDGNTNTFSGDIGATTALTAVKIGANEDNVDTTTTFNGSVKASTITIGNTNASNNDIYVVNFTNAAAETVAGVISEAAAADTTTVNFAEAAGDDAAPTLITVDDTVTVDTITVGSATAGGSAKFSSAVTATIITVDGGNHADEDSAIEFAANMTGETNLDDNTGTSLVTFSGSSATTHTGVVHSITEDDGKLLISNTAGTTFTTNIGTDGALGEIEVAATGKATFNALIDTALLDAKGTITIKENANVLDDFDIAATTGTIYIEETVTNGETVFALSDDGDATSVGGAGTATIYMPINLSNGQTVKLFTDVTDARATDINTDVEAALQDTAVINYTATVTDTDDITVTAANKSAATTASELSVNKNDATALLQAYTSAINDTVADATAEGSFQTALQGGTATAKALGQQVSPQTDMISGSTFATQAMTGSLQGIMSNRMAALRSGDAYASGMSAGSLSANSGFVQLFATDTEQKNTTVGAGTQFGYDASSAGLAIGFDGITDNGSVVGLSLSMTETDVDGKGTGKSKNNIDSYTASIYMDNSTDVGYVEGSLTIGLNENNTSRVVNVSSLDRTFKGDYESDQVSLKIGGGMPNEVGNGFVTPFGSVTVTRIETDAYTETSTTANDALRLKVAQDDIDSAIGTLGLKYHSVLGGGIPMISLAINNEFGDNTISSVNTYQGGGSSFTTSTDVEELSASLGLGYSFSSDVASVEFAYEADANDDKYLSHYGSLKVVGKF